MRFQKPVRLDSSEPEHFTQLRFADSTGPELFQRESFESAAWQVTLGGYAGDQFIRDLKGYFHKTTLTGGQNGVKRIAFEPPIRRRRNLSQVRSREFAISILPRFNPLHFRRPEPLPHPWYCVSRKEN